MHLLLQTALCMNRIPGAASALDSSFRKMGMGGFALRALGCRRVMIYVITLWLL